MGDVRPILNPAVWRYAVEDAAGGAMLWRGERGEIVAFNVAHKSGVEGWMGPRAVRPEAQGSGVGKEVVRAGNEWLLTHATPRADMTPSALRVSAISRSILPAAFNSRTRRRNCSALLQSA